MRSVLFTPGTRIDRVRKAWAAGQADVIVADLEDAVPPEHKDEARAAVASALRDTSSASVRAVRINPFPDALALADLDAVLPARPDMIVVPKAEDPDVLARLRQRIPDDIPLLLIIETAKGVLQAQAVAAIPGVAAVAFGAEDLAADAGMQRSPENTEVAVPRSLVALAAAASGVAAIDMITADIPDTARFRREADEAVALGYAGKMCLHPSQVQEAHAAWTPAPERIDWARRVMAEVEAAGAGAGGVVVVDGQMVDVPLVRQAEAILERARLSDG